MTSFYILSPFLCLVSRVSNVLTLNRTDAHSLDQLRASISIVKCYIYELLDNNEEAKARQLIENINKLSHSSTEGIRLYLDFGIDIFEAAPEDVRLHASFNSEHYPRMRDALFKKRARLKRAKALKHAQKGD